MGGVSINKEQYFEEIAEEIWIVVTAINHTIEIQKEIDNLYPEIEKEIIEFKNLGDKK
jgi:hypothetical protein